MNLSEDDIIAMVESYRNKHGHSQEEMAKLCGISASMYNKWIKKVTKSGRIKYLLTFLENTNQNINTVFPNRNISLVEEPKVTTYSCPDCIAKQKEIDALKIALDAKEELIEFLRNKKSDSECG